MTTLRLLINFLVLMTSFYAIGQEHLDSVVSTIGKGMGTTADAALKDSFRDAVERAVGVFVDAELQAENDQLIRDSVLTHSNAYIEGYRKISESKTESGLVEVRILAKVKKGKLTRKLRDTMPDRIFSLGNELKRQHGIRQQMKLEFERRKSEEAEAREQVAAQEISKEKRDADAVRLLKATWADFNPSAMMVDVTATGGKPVVNEENGDDRGNCLGRTYTAKVTQYLVEAVPFTCTFKVLEDELKSVSSIRVRVAE